MKIRLIIICSLAFLCGCTNTAEPFHSFTNQLGLTNNNNYVPQAQVSFALPNNWETEVVQVKSVGVKQAPAPKGTYEESNKNDSNNLILNSGVKDPNTK